MKINKFFKAAALSLALALTIPSVLPTAVPASTVEAAAKKLNKKKLTLPKKGTYQLTVNTTKKVTWKSSNTKVATVSKKGKVTAKKAGTAKITATFGKKKLTCKVTVANVRLNMTKATITMGSTDSSKNTLQLRVLGLSEAQQAEIAWFSSNEDVAEVNYTNGAATVVSAKDEGEATITAKYRNVTMTCEVTVEKSGRTVNPKVYPNMPAVFENTLEEDMVANKSYYYDDEEDEYDGNEEDKDKYDYKTYGAHLLDDVTITNAAVAFVSYEEAYKTQTDNVLKNLNYTYHVTIEGKADPIAANRLVGIQLVGEGEGVNVWYAPDTTVNEVAFKLYKDSHKVYGYSKADLHRGLKGATNVLYAKCGEDGSFRFNADVKLAEAMPSEVSIAGASVVDIYSDMQKKWNEGYDAEKKAKEAAKQ